MQRVLILIGALGAFVGLSLIGCQSGEEDTDTAGTESVTASTPDAVSPPETGDLNPEASTAAVRRSPGVPVFAPGSKRDDASGSTPDSSVGDLNAGSTPPALDGPSTYAEGEARYRAHEYAAAAMVFEDYSVAHPDRPDGYFMLGLAAWKAGDPSRAAEALGRAVDLDPDHAAAQVDLARVLIDLGQPRQAVPHAEAAVDLDGTDMTARRVLARTYAEVGEYAEAEATYRAALALDDSDVWCLNNLGYLMIEMDRFEEALGPLARAVELSEYSPVFRNNLGTALERTGHYRAAALAYSGALDADSTYAKAGFNLDRVTRLGTDPAPDTFDLRAEAAAFAASLHEEAAAREATASGN